MFSDDAYSYFKSVEQDIFGSNEIRADIWMSIEEKKEAIRDFDRKRTIAHDILLKSFASEVTPTEELNNRTQVADYIARYILEYYKLAAEKNTEGEARDRVAELLHDNILTEEKIKEALISI